MIKAFYHNWCKKPEALMFNVIVCLLSFVTPPVLTWILLAYVFTVLGVFWTGKLNDW